MARPLWFVKLLKKAFPQRFLLARMTRLPLFGRAVDHLLFQGDDILYLPKDHVIRIDAPLDMPEEMALPSQVVEHFIERAGYHWVMNACICRDAHQCKDYPIDLGCLFLGEAAAGINPKLGRRVTKEEALAHVRRARALGLVHMIGRNKLDTVWLGVGPGTRLVTICNCCPCCCLWRIAPHLTPSIGAKISRMPGVSVAVTDRCTGCGACTRGICFVDAIHMEGQRAAISEACRGCGRCADLCPQKAIQVSCDPRAVGQAIARLSPLFDLSGEGGQRG